MPSRPLPGFKRENNRLGPLAQQASRQACYGKTRGFIEDKQAQQTQQAVRQTCQPGYEIPRNACNSAAHESTTTASCAHGGIHKPVEPVEPINVQQIRGSEDNRLPIKPVVPVTNARLRPPPGSLHARLCEAGATVRTYGGQQGAKAEVELPAGISAELLHEVEARGWCIIPGGRANAEAEHDSWLNGVPISELIR